MSACGAIFRARAGLAVTTIHGLCGAMPRDPCRGRGYGPLDRKVPGQPVELVLSADPPDHTGLRVLVSKAFTPRMVERLRPRAEAIPAEPIGMLREGAEVISGLAYPLPVMVITEILGVPPEDRDRFRGCSEILARALTGCLQTGSCRTPAGPEESFTTPSATSSRQAGTAR
ncbi:hypothetical protein ACQEVF_19615 [Nonomuraea polychroma]|uniref:hypothetical protein n=1 Tax=Nonomuraea polychroma TaxID=46176 RepID=UPI003D926D1E